MSLKQLARIRNIGIIAHIDAGKTTTTERMLYYSGTTARIGDVDQGDTVTDYLPAERARGITIQSAAISFGWDRHQVNLVDTPGHADFGFEVTRSLKVLDGAVTILDAVAGVEAQTETVFRQSRAVPKLLFVNKMDRPGAGFGRTVRDVVRRLRTRVLLLNVPYFEKDAHGEDAFAGVLDVLRLKVLHWGAQGAVDVREPGPQHLAELRRCRESLVETLGDVDDAVVNAFLDTEDHLQVPVDVLNRAIRSACLSHHAVPVLCGASFRNIGVQPLMDAVNLYLPSPLDVLPDMAHHSGLELTQQGLVVNGNPHLTVGLAFKVITDPVRGSLVFVRVYSGVLKSHSTLYVNGHQLRAGKLLVMHANVPEEVAQITAGNIGVIVSNDIKTGDTILAHSNNRKLGNDDLRVVVNPIDVPPPVFTTSLEPRTTGDKRGLDAGLEVLLREDPSLKVTRDDETGQTLLSGMGELHLEIATDRLRDLKAKFEIGKVMVSYRERILAPKTATSTIEDAGYKLSVEVSPYAADAMSSSETKNSFKLGDLNFFVAPASELLGSAPNPVVLCNALASGCVAMLQHGPVRRFPLHGTVIRVTALEIPDDGGSTADSNSLMRQCLASVFDTASSSNFEVLEPMMDVTIEVSARDIGNVIQDLTSARNGVISSIDSEQDSEAEFEFQRLSEEQYVPEDYTMKQQQQQQHSSEAKGQKINAVVPLKEMIGYLSKLRSLTQGRSTFAMELRGMETMSRDRLKALE